MASADWIPEMVVGIDFGMTCTGIAYSMAPEWSEPKTIQHWPGKMISELANKCPTLLSYDAKYPRAVTGWGFLCDQEDENADIKEFFKLHLDPAYRDDRPDAPRLEEAQQWFQDYLRCVHGHIEQYFSDSFPRWRGQKLEFLFSVPTTWKSPGMIAETEKLIKGAGFGTDGMHHRVTIGLTEAEAAAVYASKQQFEKDDVILVCDAGGGTTDVNVLKLLSPRGDATRLQQLSWVEGRPIGSALIDMKFQQLLAERLQIIRSHLAGEPEEIAEHMMQGRFERFKCSFGSGAAADLPTIPLAVPTLPPGFDHPGVSIEDSKMIIRKEELQRLFDIQIDRMLQVIDEQLERLEKMHPREQITYMVMSGGFGSSPYVRKCIKARYGPGLGTNKPNAQDMNIVLVAEPQLAVVQGLVMDRIQAISRGSVVFNERCCRLSYGMICRELYNETIHLGEDVVHDPRDGKRWAVNQIDWFIIQGQSVASDGISKPYRMKLRPGDEHNAWKSHVVISTNPRERLPRSMKQDGAKRLCEFESVLDGVDLKLKNRHWYNFGEKYLRAQFDVKVVLGAADLKFQLWSKGGRVCSKDHETIEVKWDPPVESPSKEAGNEAAMYRM